MALNDFACGIGWSLAPGIPRQTGRYCIPVERIAQRHEPTTLEAIFNCGKQRLIRSFNGAANTRL
jgi:hypothetical protein